MFKQEIVIKQVLKNILLRDEQPKITFKQWQKFRGISIQILSELEHSGGMTTRDISTRIDKTPRLTSNKLCQMRCSGLVEKVEGWGWRITRDGINIININYASRIQQQCFRNASGMLQECNSTFPLENQEQKKEECIPGCFHQKFCHIKQICKIKEYNDKTSVLCEGCVWFKSETWTGSKDSKGNTG